MVPLPPGGPHAQPILADYALGQEPLGKGKEWELGTDQEPDLGLCASCLLSSHLTLETSLRYGYMSLLRRGGGWAGRREGRLREVSSVAKVT